jgi:hypothetical protein
MHTHGQHTTQGRGFPTVMSRNKKKKLKKTMVTSSEWYSATIKRHITNSMPVRLYRTSNDGAAQLTLLPINIDRKVPAGVHLHLTAPANTPGITRVACTLEAGSKTVEVYNGAPTATDIDLGSLQTTIRAASVTFVLVFYRAEFEVGRSFSLFDCKHEAAFFQLRHGGHEVPDIPICKNNHCLHGVHLEITPPKKP